MRATRPGRAVRADRRERHVPEPDGRPAPARVSRARRRAGDRRHRGGAQPAAPDAAARAVRLSRQHDRQLLSASGHPAARAGARRDGAGRPVPAWAWISGRTSRASRRRTTTARGHGRVQPEHAAGAEPRAGRRLRSAGVRASRVLRHGGAPDRDAPRLVTRPGRRRSPGSGRCAFAKGESIRTEISTKYDRESVAALFDAAGLRIEAWPTDPATPFGLVVGAPA